MPRNTNLWHVAAYVLFLVLRDRFVQAAATGYLGVLLEPVPEALRVHLGVEGGALVQDVLPQSPAEKAGLRRFDIILSIDGVAVPDREGLRDRVRSAKPGDRLKLSVRRGTESLDLEATLAASGEPKDAGGETAKEAFLGVAPVEVPAVLAQHLGLGEGAGILVKSCLKDSPAAKAGIEENDVLVAIDGYDIKGSEDFLKLLSERKAGDKVKIELIHKGARSTVEVPLAARPDPPVEGQAGLPQEKRWRVIQRQIRPGEPLTLRKGRVIIQLPDGKEHLFVIPDELWETEKLTRKLDEEIAKIKGQLNAVEIKKQLRSLLDKLDEKLKDGSEPPLSETRGMLRHMDGEYDISIEEHNGKRTVTVRKAGKVVAENLPYEDLKTLPDDVREKVEKAAAGLVETPPRDEPARGTIKT